MLEGPENQTNAHGTETIGWLALHMSRATWNGRSYEAGRSATRANHQWWQLPFRRFFNALRFMRLIPQKKGQQDGLYLVDPTDYTLNRNKPH